MKTAFLVLLLLPFTLRSQTINYEKSIPAAFEKAKASDKLIFIHGNAKRAGAPSFQSGLQSPEVAELLNKNFVNLNLLKPDTAASRFLAKYHITVYPCYLFFDSEGNLLKRVSRASSSAEYYRKMIEEALRIGKSEKNHTWYVKEHKAGRLDGQGLKEYIELRSSLGYTDNAELVEQYVNTLSVKQLEDYQTVLFILNAGPYAYGRAYRLVYANPKIPDSIYKTEPYSVRSNINNAIIRNTSLRAVQTKDVKLAENAASFTRNTWGANYSEGFIAFEKQMLSYFKAVKDTSKFLEKATWLYDRYYILTPDSIIKFDQKQKELSASRINNARTLKGSDLTEEGGTYQYVVLTGGAGTVSNILNNAAYDIYLTGTKNERYLKKAINWSKKSLTLKPQAAFYDTLAHLLYRLGDQKEAELNQENAVRMAKEAGQDSFTVRLKAELTKMKKHTL